MLMKNRLLGLLVATAITTLGFSAASAADLPYRSAPPAPIFAAAPVFTWTGFYVGVNAGYGWSDSDNGYTVAVPRGTFAGLGVGAGIADPTIGSGAIGGTLTVLEDDRDGFLGGAQIGYNWQFGVGSGLVLGVEADIQA